MKPNIITVLPNTCPVVRCSIVSLLAENIAIAKDVQEKQPLALVRFSGTWRCLGRINNYPAFAREAKSHPLIYLRQDWMRGVPVILEGK